MNKRKILGKMTYIGFSVGLAALFVFTALPYYLLSTLSYGRWGMFFTYAEVQRLMFFLFPCVAFVSAVSTIKKKNTTLDVFINIAIPLIALLVLKIAQYHLFLVILIITVVLIFAVNGCIDVWFDEKLEGIENKKKYRLCYYKARKFAVLSLMIVLCPIAIWCNWNEVHDSDEYLTYYSTYAESEKELSKEENKWEVVDEDTWNNLSVESRFKEIEKMTTYFLQDLGVDGISVYGVKELTDNRLGYYSDYNELMCINITYVANASLTEVVSVVAHECSHRQQHVIIKGITTIQDMGIKCENIECFAEAIALKEAEENYGRDSLNYDSYKENLLEKTSNQYADEMIQMLQSKGYLK